MVGDTKSNVAATRDSDVAHTHPDNHRRNVCATHGSALAPSGLGRTFRLGAGFPCRLGGRFTPLHS